MRMWWQLWSNYFSVEECQRVKAAALLIEPREGIIGHGGVSRVDNEYRRSQVRWLDRQAQEWTWFYDKIEYLFRNSNHNAFGFDLSYFHEIQFTEYDSKYKGKYDWHEDLTWPTDRCIHRKLSMVIQLSDPSEYEGGDLELAKEPPTPEQLRPQGSVIVFPSFLQHRVTPVTAGLRYSLVTWYEGPLFR